MAIEFIDYCLELCQIILAICWIISIIVCYGIMYADWRREFPNMSTQLGSVTMGIVGILIAILLGPIGYFFCLYILCENHNNEWSLYIKNGEKYLSAEDKYTLLSPIIQKLVNTPQLKFLLL